MDIVEKKIANSDITFVKVVKGLSSNYDDVLELLDKKKPKCILLPIAPEEIEGLVSLVNGELDEFMLTNYEEIYARHLAAFGEVKVPPPGYEAVMKWSLDKNVEVIGMDMPDEEFTKIFCDKISTMQFWWHSARVKRWRKKRFKADSPEDFAVKWDKQINKLQGFKDLERARERYMAENIQKNSKNGVPTLAILELERSEGILALLDI